MFSVSGWQHIIALSALLCYYEFMPYNDFPGNRQPDEMPDDNTTEDSGLINADKQAQEAAVPENPSDIVSELATESLAADRPNNLISREYTEAARNELASNAAAYREQLYAYMLSRTANPTLADDLAQDAYEATWLSIGKLRGTGNGDPLDPKLSSDVKAFVFGVGYNYLLMYYRKNQRIASRTADIENAMTVADPLPDPEKIAVTKDYLFQLWSTAEMTEEQAMVVYLYGVIGYSAPEIAEIIGKTSGTVRGLLHRARVRLEKHAKKIEQQDED